LKFINLYHNNFKHIDPDLVSGLNALTYLEINHVPCFNVIVNGTSMVVLKDSFARLCQNHVVLQQHDDLMKRLNLHKKLDDELKTSMVQLQKEAKQLEQLGKGHKMLIDKLSMNITKLSEEVSELRNQIKA